VPKPSASVGGRDLRSLPKAHLHVHLDGAMRLTTLRELAARDGLAIPDMRRYEGFAAFGEAMGAAAEVIRTEADLRRLVGEVVEDAERDGVVWLELSVWPGCLRGRLGSIPDVVALVLGAGEQATTGSTVEIGWMLAANRNRGPAEAIELAHLGAELVGAGVVSFGLDGDEAAFPPDAFVDAFSIAKRGALLSTPHAGELLGAPSVRAALELLGADRILHGIRAVEDRVLLQRLAASGTCLDVCPSSNVLLGIVPDVDSHPLPALLRAGVTCSLNADDPLLFSVGILKEYELARDRLGLTDQLADVARASLEASAAPRSLVRDGLRKIDQWVRI
jgi:adenosine deaminase